MNKADQLFVQNMQMILSDGVTDEKGNVRPAYADGTPAHSIYITQVCETYDISKGEFPITTLRRIPWKNGVKEILWIYQDQTADLEILRNKYKITWWDEWNVGDDSIGQRYGNTVKKYDLMNRLLEGIKKDPYSRRHIMNLYQYTDFNETKGLYPCAYETLFSVRGEYLDMTLNQRSSDYLVAGHINKMQYTALLMMVASATGYKPGKFTHFVQNLHIYDRHTEQMQELLARKPVEGLTPKLVLNTDKKDFYDFVLEDFEMIDYEPAKPQLKFELGI